MFRSAIKPIAPDNALQNSSGNRKNEPALTDLQTKLQTDIATTGNVKLSNVPFCLDKECRDNLYKLCNQYKVSLPVILFSAFKTLIYRHTNQTELVTGYNDYNYKSGDAGTNERLKKIRPVLINLSATNLFTHLLQQVQHAVDSITNQQDQLPAPALASKLKEDVYSPKAIFTFADKADFELKKNYASQNNYKIRNTPDEVELKLTLMSDISGISGLIECSEELFDAGHALRMMEHYQVLLNEIIINPSQSVAYIRMLTDAERNKLLYEWNNTSAIFPINKCIHHLFEEQAALTPQATAVTLHPKIQPSITLTSKELTYAELNKKANQVANYLIAQGVGPDILVGIYMKRSLEMVIAILGILKAGGAYLPIDPGYPDERLNYILNDSKITIVLSQHQLVKSISGNHAQVICLDTQWNNISVCSKDTYPNTQVSPENIAYVIYTSGSTGMPKGTLIMHKGVVNYLSWCIDAYKLDEGNGCPVNTSIGFDATVTSFLSPLISGKKVTLLPEDGEIEALVEVLQSKNKFSLVKITPAHLEILNNILPQKLMEEQVNALVIGGEALTGKSLNFWHTYAPSTRIINEYGPTETVVGCCTYEVPTGKSFKGAIPIGRPIANTQIYILDSNMQPTPTGVAGEIYIGGAGVARGYLNRPELTAERFIPNPFSTNTNARLYKTGDIARYLDDGNIVFLGRTDSQVKIRGYRIELGEVEYALQQCEAVKQAVVIAKEGNTNDKYLLGYFVPDLKVLLLMEQQLHIQQVENWKGIYETEYGQTENNKNIDPEFNIVGWNDSFTGGAIPAPEMKAWLDETIEVILAEKPRCVLEIGCGTGLIFYRLAGKVQKYTGTDLSQSSIKQIKEHISKGLRDYGVTEFFTAPAHSVQLPQQDSVDTIILNSMVQYFPSETYMNAVLDKCMAMLKKEGRIIIGDVRDNRLLPLFKGRLKMKTTDASTPLNKWKYSLERDVINEEELCFSPDYFYGLRDMYPQISQVEIQWKKADYINELSLYRYTVVIHVGIIKAVVEPQWQDWNEISGKEDIFSNNGKIKNSVAIKNIPNPRLWKERIVQHALCNRHNTTVGDVSQLMETEDFENRQVQQFLQQAKFKGYHQRLFVHEDPLKMNVLLELNEEKGFIKQPTLENIVQKDDPKTNMPLFNDIIDLLRKDIKKKLLKRLPEYMVPSEFIAIRQLPLTANGKIDQAALPAPNQPSKKSGKTFVAGRSELEITLTKLFEKFTGVNSISVNDNVFELGINSMQAYRIFAQIKKITGTQLPLSILLQAPTIEQLTANLNKEESNAPWSSLVPIQPKGSRLPLYCIHAGGGTVLFYRNLSRHLGEDQPVYGLQLQGLDGKQEFHKKVEEMAEHYINEIRLVNPEGPYLLSGFCFGAIVAFEMACQLTSQGYKVALLANFNGTSPGYVNPKNKSSRIEEYEQVVPSTEPVELPERFGRKMFMKKNTREKWNYLAERFEHKITQKSKATFYVSQYYFFKVYVALLVITYRCYQILGVKAPQALRKYHFVFTNAAIAKAYKPKMYVGSMTVFRSPGIFYDPHLGWSSYVNGKIETHDIPGHHRISRQIMNDPFVEQTAKALEKSIYNYLQSNNAKDFTDNNL